MLMRLVQEPHFEEPRSSWSKWRAGLLSKGTEWWGHSPGPDPAPVQREKPRPPNSDDEEHCGGSKTKCIKEENKITLTGKQEGNVIRASSFWQSERKGKSFEDGVTQAKRHQGTKPPGRAGQAGLLRGWGGTRQGGPRLGQDPQLWKRSRSWGPGKGGWTLIFRKWGLMKMRQAD